MIKKLILISAILVAILSTNAFSDNKYPYYIEVNRATNIVSVYAPDKIGNYTNNVKNFICSTGTGTPDGTFKTSDKYEWRILFGNVYGQYATRIHGHILFHSVPYYTAEKNNLEYEEYNKLGTSASMGCIRLRVFDSKWIYDNCPAGTTVKIFYDKNATVDTYEKPVKIDVNDIEKRGWDPTDPDENNPWKIKEDIVNEPENLIPDENNYDKNTPICELLRIKDVLNISAIPEKDIITANILFFSNIALRYGYVY